MAGYARWKLSIEFTSGDCHAKSGGLACLEPTATGSASRQNRQDRSRRPAAAGESEHHPAPGDATAGLVGDDSAFPSACLATRWSTPARVSGKSG